LAIGNDGHLLIDQIRKRELSIHHEQNRAEENLKREELRITVLKDETSILARRCAGG